jgi:pyruvate dehydrogenase E2 component (dihydrolipoamide acetyltransferase)
MAEAVIMPRQGQSVESCLFTEWYKKKGDKIQKGDLLFAYETDKAAFEQEALTDGVLLEVFVDEGDEVPVLQNIAVIGDEGEEINSFRPEAGGVVVGEESETKEEAQPKMETGNAIDVASIAQTTENDLRISPRARNRAEKEGIAFADIKGTGPLGRIIERDIMTASREMPKSTPLARSIAIEDKVNMPAQGTGIGGKVMAADVKQMPSVTLTDAFEDKKTSNIRKIIAKNMYESLANTAQLTLHSSADARKILDYRKEFKARQSDGYAYNITINDLISYAVVKTLLQHPGVNAHFMGDSIRHFSNVHLGFAVDTPRGLMVPTVKNADHLTIEGLSSEIKNLATSCQQGSIDPALLQGASFTMTNLGSFGIEMFTPVLNPPQIAILGVNTITPQPADMGNGAFGFIPKVGLSLTFDHRAMDGAPAAVFLRDVCKAIEELELNI